MLLTIRRTETRNDVGITTVKVWVEGPDGRIIHKQYRHKTLGSEEDNRNRVRSDSICVRLVTRKYTELYGE